MGPWSRLDSWVQVMHGSLVGGGWWQVVAVVGHCLVDEIARVPGWWTTLTTLESVQI